MEEENTLSEATAIVGAGDVDLPVGDHDDVAQLASSSLHEESNSDPMGNKCDDVTDQQVAAGEMTSNGQAVIGYLLQQQGDPTITSGTDTSISVPPMDVTPALQAVTLADGTTAYVQPSLLKADTEPDKPIEGRTISLDDGTTAIMHDVQTIVEKASIETESSEQAGNQNCKFVDGQPIQLEDGTTAIIYSSPKDGFQPVQLEDGSTAYIQTTATEALFPETATYEPIHADSLGTGSTVNTVRLASDRALALGDKAFRCNYAGCGRLYTTHHHLKVHERSHTGDRPFKCVFPGCNKAFATGYGLKSHTRIHTGEKPYRCIEESCDKAFKTSGDLQKHVRTHTGERPFKCPFEGCDRSFTTSNIRKVHIRTHTGERPYICTEEGCGKAFASATNYKNHIRIHTGEKPYVCTVQGCNKRFTEYSSLYKHHVVHTHSKPYICNHCGKNYRQTSTLSMHKRTVHGDDTPIESELLLDDEDGDLPPEKRPKLQLQHLGDLQTQVREDGEGTLVINTSEPQVTMVTEPTMVTIPASAAQMALHQLQQSVGDSGQQIYLVTDASQLQALQALAQQQQQTTLVHTTDTISSVPGLESASVETDDAGTLTTESNIIYQTE